MYVRKRIGKRRTFYQKHRSSIVFLACAGIFLFAFALADVLRRPIIPAPPRLPFSAKAPESIPQYQPAASERLIYPYSVIPGGVRSREELALNIDEDPVVSAHFAGFRAGDAEIVKAEETQFVHVSYRLRNKIYWTSKPVRIPKGETLITDGKDTARTRCGNKVSVLPQEPVAEEEPPPEVFEIPIIASDQPPILDLTKLPEGELDFRPELPLTPIIPTRPREILPYYYRPLFVVKPQGPQVPEPGTFGLMAAGLVALLGLRYIRKK